MSTYPTDDPIAPTTPIYDETVTATAVHVDPAPGAADAAKDAAADTAGTAKDQAKQVGGAAADAGAQVGATVKEQASQVASDAAGQARELYGQATGRLSEQAGTQQRKAAAGLKTLGEDLSRMHEKDEHGGLAAELVQNVAERAGHASAWLDAREPGEVLDEVKRFAARRPGLFIGLAAVAGIVAARAVKALTAAAEPDAQTPSETVRAARTTPHDDDHVIGEPIAAFDSAADAYGPAHAGDAR